MALLLYMQKIISLFQRNYDGDRLVRDEVTPGAEWVVNGEGVATRKWDGTCCMIKDGVLYKRYDAKKGKTPPEGFIPAQEPDPVTGHWPGWLKVSDTSKEDKWHREGYENSIQVYGNPIPDGTYELVGPKVNNNRDNLPLHRLIQHGVEILTEAPRTYTESKVWFADQNIEGIVWHHPDGRMVKIKKKVFGYKW
jgi:hypothetical protein